MAGEMYLIDDWLDAKQVSTFVPKVGSCSNVAKSPIDVVQDQSVGEPWLSTEPCACAATDYEQQASWRGALNNSVFVHHVSVLLTNADDWSEEQHFSVMVDR